MDNQPWTATTKSFFLFLPGIAIVSAALLLFQVSISRLKQSRHGTITVKDHGIFRYNLLRLAACLVLTALSIVPLMNAGEKPRWNGIALLFVFSYSITLAVASMLSSPHWSRTSVRHLNTVLCATLAVYVYRDIYPLGTFFLIPPDYKDEGSLLWVKVSVIAFAGVFIPLISPRKYIPVDVEHPKVPSSEQTCSLLSRLTFAFMDSIIMKAYRSQRLWYEDLPPLCDYDYAEYLKQRSFRYLDPTIVTKRRNIFFSLIRVFAKEFAVLAALVVLQSVLDFATPVVIKNLLGYLETDGANAFFKPWVWILLLFIGPILQAMASESYLYISMRQVVHAEAILIETILEHALRIRVKAETHSSSDNSKGSPPLDQKPKNVLVLGHGKVNLNINNLITTDIQSIIDGKESLRLVVVPLQFALCVLFLYNVLGWSAFVGLAIITVSFPVPRYITKSVQATQKMKMKKTDARVQIVTESVHERTPHGQILFMGVHDERQDYESREEELTYIRRIRFLELATIIINYVIPILTMLATYATYTAIMKESLTASKLSYSCRKCQGLAGSLNFSIHLARDKEIQALRITFPYNRQMIDQDIGFKNATFILGNSSDYFYLAFMLRIDGELIFKRGTINLIIGSTGSGKTSMLMALLSEMHFISSGPDAWYNLPRNGGVAYAAQESWVQNATIKENIVFRSPLDETRYKKVIHQCALERDLELFQAGDETEVGEKGLTLSGGQKARVTLARAIYSKAEIILLDDILAALDVHTSKWIVDKCFKGDLIKDRTVLMVTHNVGLTQSVAGFVVSMKDGRIVNQGPVSKVLSENEFLECQVELEELVEDSEAFEDDDKPLKKPTEGQGKLIVAEEVQLGGVGWPTMRLYLKGLGGRYIVLFFVSFIGSLTMSELLAIFQTWFLGYWASQYEIHRDDPTQVNVAYYLTGYCHYDFVSRCLLVLLSFLNLSVWGFESLSPDSQKTGAVSAEYYLKVLWLDTTPTSRVITRCTQDMRDVDALFPIQLNTLIRLTVMMLGQFCSIIYFSPAFLLPGILVSLAGALCGSVYIKAQLPIKRIQSNAKAPVLAHFGSVMAGLVSVRAYGVQDAFIVESLNRINYYSRASRVFWNLNRWIGVRLDLLGIYDRFSLAQAVMFSTSILYYIRIVNRVQVIANSLERINAYIKIEQEPKPTKNGVPPAYWPSSGDLRVVNLNARYSPNGPPVLHGISFHVKSGERIGVVGRTGSGKVRLYHASIRVAKYTFDGIPTSSLNLHDLRTKITIIPQMPELLSGTVRRNLDPFDQYEDAALYDTLRSAGLYSIQSEDTDARVGLETTVGSGGNNLSVGQRQILALARAMIRGSKLLILDEATSAIDYKTDAVIQSSLRQELKDDVSLITVAHRLQTIMDADKIMVLDAGTIVEYDSPIELLKNKVGYLRTLVDESADREQLLQMAGVGPVE
ncbi:P-loop containing nucleoside triphosphate hydrolase protein [Gymnopus androsaceus JB14]|uniref:P-loop containing nucleoside triphosphate hydrolase protein n=1 Tax=Gymnopus androsaceus JB14 TaxID=1447944 RepID=A0A6A4H4W1_9AGAR|nr:P-loop containing nucleoside triphosphate hydrolase protein [Gymnopus androsaceus JB14]